MKVGGKRLAMAVLWPAFLAAVLAEGAIFSWLDPQALAPLAPMTLYSVGFFVLWTCATLASLLTAYLIAVPDDV